MCAAYQAVIDAEERNGIAKYRVRHYPTLENTTADLLSKGHVEEAKERVRQIYGRAYEYHPSEEVLTRWEADEKRVREAASH